MGLITPISGAVSSGSGGSAISPPRLIVSKTTDDPPAPSTGSSYVVPVGGTGDFSGHDNEIANWGGSNWTFITPGESWQIYVDDEDVYYFWDSSAWVPFTNGSVSGSGTTNYIPKFTGASSVGDSSIAEVSGDVIFSNVTVCISDGGLTDADISTKIASASPSEYTGATDIDGIDSWFRGQSGGAKSGSDTRGGDLIFIAGGPGSGSAARYGKFDIRSNVKITGRLDTYSDTLIEADCSDVSSDIDSKLLDLQVSTASKFAINKVGHIIGGNPFTPQYSRTSGLAYTKSIGYWDVEGADSDNNVYSIHGVDLTSVFSVGALFYIEGSTSNDDDYTVVSSSLRSAYNIEEFSDAANTIMLEDSVGDVTSDFPAGRYFTVSGANNSANNGVFKVQSVVFDGTNTKITVTSTAIVDETTSPAVLDSATIVSVSSVSTSETDGKVIVEEAFVPTGIGHGTLDLQLSRNTNLQKCVPYDSVCIGNRNKVDDSTGGAYKSLCIGLDNVIYGGNPAYGDDHASVVFGKGIVINTGASSVTAIGIDISIGSAGNNAVLIGHASASGPCHHAVGIGSSVSVGIRCVGIGYNAVATGIYSVALGDHASATHAASVAIGSGATSGADYDIVLGAGSHKVRIVGTTDSTSSTSGALRVAGGVGIAKTLYLGTRISFDTGVGIQIGDNSETEEADAIAIGRGAKNAAGDSVIIGVDANGHSQVNNVCVGPDTNCTDSYSVAIGHAAKCNGTRCFAAVDGAEASGTHSVAIGRASLVHANADYGVAIGYEAEVGDGHDHSWAIGYTTATQAANEFRIGNTTYNLSVVVGDGDVVVEDTGRAVYIGDPGTDGTWRMIRSGNDLKFERRESGSYVTKDTIAA